MTLPVATPETWWQWAEELMLEFAPRLKWEVHKCDSCGCPHYKHPHWQEDLCVYCSDVRQSFDLEKRRTQQRKYQRNYIRVAKDRRRKENKNESRHEVQ